jgi:hypothetical protein
MEKESATSSGRFIQFWQSIRRCRRLRWTIRSMAVGARRLCIYAGPNISCSWFKIDSRLGFGGRLRSLVVLPE